MSGKQTSKDIKEIPKGASFEDSVNTVNELIQEHNYLSKNITFNGNFNGQIIENIVFAAGETRTIYHGLGIKPKYRIILRQAGNGVLDDVPSGWNNYSVQVKNNGAVEVTATIFLVRE